MKRNGFGLLALLVGLCAACAGPAQPVARLTATPSETPTQTRTALYPTAKARATAAAPPTPTVQAPEASITFTPISVLPSLTPTPFQSTPATVKNEVLDVWDDPAHEKDYWSRQTQLITGERVRVLEEQGDWARIVVPGQPSHKDPRGYPGWVRRSGLAPGWADAEQYAVVMVGVSFAREKPQVDSDLAQRLALDARLPVSQLAAGWVEVALPDGRTGWIRRSDVRLSADPDQAVALDGFYLTAQSLVGIPYLWGGTETRALDCAGFIYRLFHAYGISLPRDADDQAVAGQPVSLDQLRRGDLVFSSDVKGGAVTHVVMVWGSGQVIDANSPAGLTIHSLGDVTRTGYLVGARRYLP